MAAPNAPPEEAGDFERRFREYVLPSDRKHSALITALTVPPGVIFILADYRLYGLEATFWAYAGVRLVFGLLGISAAYWIARAPSAAFHDRLVLAWLVFLSAVVVGLDATRPPDVIAGVLIEVLAVVFIYTAFRFPLRMQVIAAGLLTGGSATVNLLAKDQASFLTALAILVALSIANIMGFLTSAQVADRRRSAFDLLEKEVKLRLSLQRALAKVRRLEGILPICATCKQIRDEHGAWQQVEIYIRDRSEADFTHGLCPTCAAEYTVAGESTA